MTVAENPTVEKYATYKHSKEEWLGDIPEHWDCLRMKHLFKDVSEKNRPMAELLSVTQDQGVVPRTQVQERMVMPTGSLESFKFIEKGDFAISLRSFEGGLEYCHHDGIISPAYTVLKAKRHIHAPFYRYLFKSAAFISGLQTSVVGIREGKNISYAELCYSFLPFPLIEEQTRIAEFLDRKTAQIDKAIDQKEKLIELLKERRQILIHKAITRGLNPNVTMKDSGVEWIGEVPEHWEVMKLTHAVEVLVDGTHFSPKSYNEGPFKYITAKNIKAGGFDFSDLSFVTERDHTVIYRRCPVKKDDVLYIKDGATAGVAMINNLEEEFSLLSSVAVIRPISQILLSRYLKHYLNSALIRNYIATQIVGGAITRLTLELIGIFKVIIPPREEQNKLVNHIESIDVSVNEAVMKLEAQIQKLKEYKAALINSAVAGKIKI
jgi:type I restriction enzyme, S subunit